ncbi:MAG TPA: 4-hydroxybenzoate octaprenyltransferase [Acidiferrobacteraceae bacterium]|nr:4-hydroxybenzoate octaprenyltransferase [Acidiferrobacteraceae bacterium]
MRLMRLHRPIGSLLLLWPTLWALWIARAGHPSPGLVALFVMGVLVTRSAGCVINDYLDRDLDPHVARTRDRPLASGRIAPREALALALALFLVAVALAAVLNPLAWLLAAVAVVLGSTYPLMKRWVSMPQVYLGLAFGWGIPMAFAAEQGRVPAVAWVLLLANVLWTVAYDTAYAMADRADDVRAGIRSTAILFGRADRLWIGLFHAGALGVLLGLGLRLHLGAPFLLGLGVAALLALYQQYLIRDREPAACLAAFHNNNWFGGAVFAGLVLAYFWR